MHASKSQKPSAVDLLVADHREVQKMFRKAERLESGDSQLQEIIERACAALTEHAQLEEDIFYPAVREQADAEDIIDEAEIEHDVAKQLIAQLQSAGADLDRAKAMFKVLGEYINHHIQEEENEMFPAAKRAKIDMTALGEQIMMRKQGRDAVAMGGNAGEAAVGLNESGDGENGEGRTRADHSGGRDSAGSDSIDEDDEVDVETPRRMSGRSSSRRASH